MVAISVLLFLWRRRLPGAAALWGCHLVLSVPMLSLSEYPHTAADRYSHVQEILWSAALGLVLQALWRESRERQAMLAGFIVAGRR